MEELTREQFQLVDDIPKCLNTSPALFKNMRKDQYMPEQLKECLRKNWKQKYACGYVNPMLGKKRPDLSEYNRKYKAAQMSGDKNPNKRPEVIAKRMKTIAGKTKEIYGKKGPANTNWKGGISFDGYPWQFNKELKAIIRARDNYTCQICDITEAKYRQPLRVHHIDYNKENCELYNLVSLCVKCHTKTNSNRHRWTEYFIRKMGTHDDMFHILHWQDIINDCLKVVDFLSDKEANRIVAIPRGGIVPAVIIANNMGIKTGTRVTSANDVIIDDIVDFGGTLKHWHKRHPTNMFVCLCLNIHHYQLPYVVNFYARKVSKFIKFPWETKDSAKVDYKEKK